MKIKIVCRKDAVNRNGRVPLVLRFTHRRQTKTVALGMTVDPSEWDEESQRITCGCPDCRTLQFQLDRALNEYYKKIRRLEALEIDVNFDTLFEPSQERLDCTVGTYFRRMIERMESADKHGTASKYRVTYSLWGQFHPQDMRFEEITLSLLRDFELFLRRRGNKDNSIATKFSVLRAVYNRASEERVFSSNENPFLRFKLGRLWTATRKRAISKEDIRRLKALDLSHDKTGQRLFARDIFLFSYLMAGINFHDVACLKYSDIQDGRLMYARHKTRKAMNCRINDEAQAIMNKYKNYQRADDYIFPILDERIHKTQKQQTDRIGKVLKAVNKSLKELGNELGLTAPLTTYIARHTFACLAVEYGMPIDVLAKILGHSNTNMTRHYAKFSEQLIGREMRKMNEQMFSGDVLLLNQ